MAAKETLFLSIVGIYSLFPLLHPTSLLLIKSTLFLSYVLLQFVTYRSLFNIRFNVFERIYCIGFGPLFVYTELVHRHIPMAVTRLPFLPLLLTSVYCAIGVTYFWLTLTWKFVSVRVSQAGGSTSTTTTSVVIQKTVVKSKKEVIKVKSNKKVDKVVSVGKVTQKETNGKAPPTKKSKDKSKKVK